LAIEVSNEQEEKPVVLQIESRPPGNLGGLEKRFFCQLGERTSQTQFGATEI
jgi:hypothetical protein